MLEQWRLICLRSGLLIQFNSSLIDSKGLGNNVYVVYFFSSTGLKEQL